MEFKATNISGLKDVITHLISLMKSQKHFCLNGLMGAGKTTLISELCNTLSSKDKTSSPTYSIVNEYRFEDEIIYHFDLYRLENEIELLDIGIEDMLDSNAYCFIEWPEKILNFLPSSYVQIDISLIDNVRNFKIEVKTI